jgi:hydroxymethylpyrimidine/phosphomethylpyrimidine kinase
MVPRGMWRHGMAEDPPVALTIAGSDSGGGAGIQADLKTFAAHGVYGCTALTAVTAQHTRGVTASWPVPAELLAQQLDAVLADFPVRAAKTGMLPDPAAVEVVLRRRLPYLVVDPVMVASTGAELSTVDDWTALCGQATVLTPNIPEASALLGGAALSTPDDLRAAATELSRTGARCVVVTGGHLPGGECGDAVWHEGRTTWLPAPRVDTRNTHGTGCTFSAAIAANLAADRTVPQAIAAAKRYVTAALRAAAGWRLGSGAGPLDHNPEEEWT